MFDFLNFFSSNSFGGASIFATGTSLLNTYAHLRANKEQSNQALWEQRHKLKALREQKRFDGAQLLERTAEYGAISSYHVDMLRQEQMHNRQVMGYNILQSGIGITSTDSAGLLLKHMAYMDEMKARSVEAEYFHGRPRSNYNPNMITLQQEAANRNIYGINSASPWMGLGTILRGARELGEISRLGESGSRGNNNISGNRPQSYDRSSEIY